MLLCTVLLCTRGEGRRVAEEEERRETRTQLGLARGHPNTWYILVPGCLGAVRAV